MIHPALDFELNQIKDRFDYAFKRLKEFATNKKHSEMSKKHSEIIYRILTSRVLYDAIGEGDIYGYTVNWDPGPLSRMEFLVHFVGHELLDDGDPGVGWHKYNLKTGEKDACREQDKRAQPFFHHCHEMLPPGSKRLYEEEVIWVLDWHERYDEERYEGEDEERKPEDPMLIELAKSIIGR